MIVTYSRYFKPLSSVSIVDFEQVNEKLLKHDVILYKHLYLNVLTKFRSLAGDVLRFDKNPFISKDLKKL